MEIMGRSPDELLWEELQASGRRTCKHSVVQGVSLTAGFWKVFGFERPSVEDGLELLCEA